MSSGKYAVPPTKSDVATWLFFAGLAALPVLLAVSLLATYGIFEPEHEEGLFVAALRHISIGLLVAFVPILLLCLGKVSRLRRAIRADEKLGEPPAARVVKEGRESSE